MKQYLLDAASVDTLKEKKEDRPAVEYRHGNIVYGPFLVTKKSRKPKRTYEWRNKFFR